MVYLWNMVIFHGELLNNQRVNNGINIDKSSINCLRENLQVQAPYFMGKSMVSGWDFPLDQSIDVLYLGKL